VGPTEQEGQAGEGCEGGEVPREGSGGEGPAVKGRKAPLDECLKGVQNAQRPVEYLRRRPV